MIGATTSQSLDLTLLNKGDMVYGTSTIKVEIGLKIGSTIEYIPMGIYNIDDVEKTDYTIKITAFDNMMKFERNFTTTLGDTLTLQQVASELTRITGVQFTGNLPAYTVKKLEGFSCREILGYVASLCGGNAIITRDGKFTIVTPKDNSYSIGTSNYFDYKREETKYKIGKISCQSGEEILSKGSIGVDSMELQFENPWVNNTILTDIYTKLNGFEYLGYSMKWQGDPSLDVGDIVTITDKKGVLRKHPILSQKFTYTGGLTAEMGAKGENKNKNEFSGSGPSAKKVERVVMELALINKALIDVAYIGDLTAGNIKFDTASGTIMDLQTLLSKFVTGENGQFLNLTTDNVTISNALIKDVIAKSISVEDLKASTISTNKYRITSDNGGIEIVGATQQFKDKNNKVRIQIGQDTQGNFNFILRGEDGTTTLIDHTGIKEKAIADKLIKSNMVADNAIGEQQINYSSLVTGLNKDTNTSLIQASKVAIDLTGQSLDVAFNSLKSNVDNMEIGGRNLQGNADFNKPLSGTWRYDSQFMSINEDMLCDGYKSVKILRTNAITTSTRYLYTGGGVIPAKYGEEFTMSFMYYIPEDVSQEIDGTFQVGVWFYKDRNAGAGSIRKNLENEIVKGKWIKVVVSGKAKDVDTKSVAFVIGFDKNCEVYISKPKLERGNKATDFTVAPEDVEEKIESNTTAITVAQGQISGLISENTIIKGDITTISNKYTSLKATVDGINTTVESHTSSIGNLTTDLSGVSGKVATVENKQASLEQNLNGFKTAVASTYSTKTELSTVDGKVTGLTSRVSTAESSITQLNNSIDLSVSNLKKIVQEGNNNLVSNSNWFKGPSGWRLSTTLAGNYFYGVSGSMALEDKHYIRLGHSNNNETNIIYADSSKFPVAPGEKITYGAFGAATSNVRFRIYLLFTSNIDDINTDNSFMPGYTSILYEGNAAYTKKNLTVTVPDGAIRAFIRVRIDKIDTSINTDSSGVFSSLMVRKGEEVFEWCPSQGDSYTYIDEQTVKLQVSINDITSRVSSTESTISTINGSVSSLTTRMNSAEQKITPTAITATISSSINNGTSSISTTQFVMDRNGLLIKNGALTIRNNAGESVLNSDTNGNLTVKGTITGSTITGSSINGGTINGSAIICEGLVNRRELFIEASGGYSPQITFRPAVKGANGLESLQTKGHIWANALGLVFQGYDSITMYADNKVSISNNLSVLGNLNTNRLAGENSSDKVYIGNNAFRIDTTGGISRLYNSWIGSSDSGIQIWGDGAISIKSYNTTIHRFNANGTKTGGTKEIDGTVYGMSPTDSPQTLIEYIIPNVLVEEELKLELDPIYIKMISYYVAFLSNNNIEIKKKGLNYIILMGNGVTDILIKGQRNDADDYFRIMGGLEHGVGEEQTV